MNTLNLEKETYIYSQIGTKLLTSPSGDPLNLLNWKKESEVRELLNIHFILQIKKKSFI